MKAVSLKKTVVVQVQAAQITELNATLDDGTMVIPVTGPVSVNDWAIKDASGNLSVLAAADYAAELVTA
ncbi:hypothetical protein [Methylomonas sp. AM2-LC]|uniref:hypothetical protein n=1 Tax=Methylomonas sp. AM2-LC TaxID=3153301 RepID=UPI003265C2A7